MTALPVPIPQDFSADSSRILVSEYFWSRSARDPNATPNAFKHFSHALSAFRKFLGERPPTIGHLTSDTLDRLATWLLDRGRKPSTTARIVEELVRLGRAAAAEGLLAEAPTVRKIHKRGAIERRPLSFAEIERLLAQCLLEPGDVAGVPAKSWWPAFLLVILNCQLSAPAALAIPAASLRRCKGGYDLRAGGFVFAIHPLTEAALAQLPAERERLFPWNRDPCQVFYHLNRLLRLAGIPRQKGLSFDRLQAAALDAPGLLDQLDAGRIARLAEQIRTGSAAREDRKEEQRRRQNKAIAAEVPAFRRRVKETREIYAIQHDSERSLRRYFRETYCPRRLIAFGASQRSIDRVEMVLNRLAAWAGVEVTLDGLARRDFLESWRSWLIARGLSPRTVNSYVATLLALWRYAKRKELVGGNPDYLDKLKAPKKKPVAWTLDEFSRLLAAAARLPGRFNGLPYAKLMPALLLTLFDTGMRVSAAIQLRSADLDGQGFLHVDAETQKQKAEQGWRLSSQTHAALLALEPHTRGKCSSPAPYDRRARRRPFAKCCCAMPACASG